MDGESRQRERFMPHEEACGIFALQLKIFPELMDEVYRLSGGIPGVMSGIMETVGEAISYDPIPDTTIERIRELVGAPEDPAELERWQEDFWQKIKTARRAAEQ